MGTSRMSPVRRTVVRLTVGSFSSAALLGVAALLRPGHFGSTEGRILLTTLIVGAGSVLMLCYLAPTGERSRSVGVAGGVAALVSGACALVLVWGRWQQDPPVALLRTFGLSGVVALTLAQFALLLAVVRRRPSVVRLLAATLVAGTVLAGLVSATILGWNPGSAGARLIGVVAILDVLGTVVTMALGVFGAEPRGGDDVLDVRLPGPEAAAVRALAAGSGRSPDDVVLAAVRDYLRTAPADTVL
jgi:hypothetical protein